MHTLHTYLVKIVPEYSSSKEEIAENLDELTEEILADVLEKTDGFNGIIDTSNVYVSRSEGPGSWANEYPPVLFGAINEERFIAEFQKAVSIPEDKLEILFKTIQETEEKNSDLFTLNKNGMLIKFPKSLNDIRKKIPIDLGYTIHCIISILEGEYSYLTPYYDLVNYTIWTPEKTIKDVNENPWAYALVFIECYF